MSTFCGFQVEAPQWNQTYLNVKPQINIHMYTHKSSVSNSLQDAAAPQPPFFFWVLCLGDITENCGGYFFLKERFQSSKLLIHLSQLTGLTCESCFMVNFCPRRWMKNESFRKGSAGICSTPQGHGWFLSVCETPRLDGDKGRGAAVWSPDVFSLAVECFRCGTLSAWSFKGKRVIPETGKCYKQYGNTWPLAGAAAASCTAAECCCLLPRENIHNWPCVCVCVCWW